mgnify:CR=1 FL=1
MNSQTPEHDIRRTRCEVCGLNYAAYRAVVEALKAICAESPKVEMRPHPMGEEEPDYASPAGVTISGEAILAGRHALTLAEQPNV